MRIEADNDSSPDLARESASRLWSIHLRYLASLSAEKCDRMVALMLEDANWATALLEIAQCSTDALTSAVVDDGDAWRARAAGLLADPNLSDRRLSAHARFVLASCADQEFGRLDAFGKERSRARARVAELLADFDKRWPSTLDIGAGPSSESGDHPRQSPDRDPSGAG